MRVYKLALAALVAAMTCVPMSTASAATLTVLAAECAIDVPTVIPGLPPAPLECGSPGNDFATNVTMNAISSDYYELGLAIVPVGPAPLFGGVMALAFDAPFTGTLTFVDALSFLAPQAMEVSVNNILDFFSSTVVGQVDNLGNAVVTINTPVQFLFLADISAREFSASYPVTSSYRLSSILLTPSSSSTSEVPLPAAFPLFLAGLAGFGAAIRKRKAA